MNWRREEMSRRRAGVDRAARGLLRALAPAAPRFHVGGVWRDAAHPADTDLVQHMLHVHATTLTRAMVSVLGDRPWRVSDDCPLVVTDKTGVTLGPDVLPGPAEVLDHSRVQHAHRALTRAHLRWQSFSLMPSDEECLWWLADALAWRPCVLRAPLHDAGSVRAHPPRDLLEHFYSDSIRDYDTMCLLSQALSTLAAQALGAPPSTPDQRARALDGSDRVEGPRVGHIRVSPSGDVTLLDV